MRRLLHGCMIIGVVVDEVAHQPAGLEHADEPLRLDRRGGGWQPERIDLEVQAAHLAAAEHVAAHHVAVEVEVVALFVGECAVGHGSS